MSKWIPIPTEIDISKAPFNGEPIIIASKYSKGDDGKYKGNCPPTLVKWISAKNHPTWPEGMWSIGGAIYSIGLEATHYMYLPESPPDGEPHLMNKMMEKYNKSIDRTRNKG